MSMELKEKIIEMLEGISADLQAKYGYDVTMRAEIKDYFDTKKYNVRWYGLQFELFKKCNKDEHTIISCPVHRYTHHLKKGAKSEV